MAIDYTVVDVFTARAGQGNPAAVVVDAAGLSDGQMQQIAAELNLSETAFVLPAEMSDGFRLRWFTPGCEVDMCGHATLAAVQVLRQAGRWEGRPRTGGLAIPIDTRGGRLTAWIDADPGGVIWLDLVDPVLTPARVEVQEWARLLGGPPDGFTESVPPVVSQDGDLIVFVRDVFTLNALQPAFDELAGWCRQRHFRGVCVATTSTLAPAITVQSRFFGPAAGVNEDPVTGSVHGPLAAHLVACSLVPAVDDLAALMCTQGIPGGRMGLVRALVQRQPGGVHAVRIGGQCVTANSGVLYL